MRMTWHGGYSYSHGTETEHVDDAADAIGECEDRYRNRDGSTPAVDYGHGDTAAWLYRDDTVTDSTDIYPDFIVEAVHRVDKAGEYITTEFRTRPA